MGKALTVFAVLVVVAGAVMAAVPTAHAQNNVTCDSTTVLMLLLAQDFGFQPKTDISKLELGQYKPYFDAMKAAHQGGAAGGAAQGAATPKPAEGTPMPTVAPAAVMLMPPTIANEDPICGQVRTEVETFLWNEMVAGKLIFPPMASAQTGQQGSTTSQTGQQGNNAGAQTGQAVDVKLTEFKVDMPATLKAGDLTFNVSNDGKYPHSLAIEGNGVDTKLPSPLQPGEKGTLTVNLKAGTYTFYCPVDGHKDKGMTLQVTVQ